MFSHWSGPGVLDGSTSLTSPVIVLPPVGTVSVTANFVLIDYTLTVTSAGGTGGTTDRVTVSAPGPYHYGDIVTLTANPQAGETFSSWGGDLGGSNNPETITINANKTVEANFAFIDYALTVTSAGGTGGTTDRVTVSAPGPYHYGDIVTLTANPQAGETFSSWGGDLGGSNNPETITINANKTVEANFAFIDYALTVTSAGGTGGTTDRVTVSAPGPYHYGDIVTLTANPQAGETFSSWGGDLGGSNNPETITINANKTVEANFAFIDYALTVTSAGGTGGTTDRVTVSAPGPYHYGDIVTLTANPQAGETFSSWGGDLGGSNNPETITINANKTVEANFAFIDYALTVTSAGGTGGTTDRVTVSAPGPYHYGDIVTLTANPQAGETFSSWGGDLGGSNNPETITINANKTVEANFAFIDYALTVTSAGGTGGTTDRVTVSAPGPYHYGDIVTLTANPQAGETFSSWGGDLGGSNNPETITINANKTVEANFAFIDYALTVTSAGGTGGTTDRVTVSAPGPYHYGDIVTLTANPQAGETFSSWGGDLGGSNNPETITINANKTVEANFAFIDYALTVTSAGGTGGTTDRVTVSAPGPYHYGDIVTLTANPQAGETFSSWGGDLGGSNNPETITINANKTVEANFAFIDYALTVTSAGGTGGTTDRVTVSAPGPYHYGDIVTLTANPQAGETFSSWGGDLGGSNNPETITINANKTVEANFAFIDYALTVTSAGGTGGTTDRVTVSAPGPYHYGDIVTLTANPQAGETFSSWGGDLGGSNNPETITINANKTVEANFAFIDYALTVTSAGGTGGTTDRVTVSAPGPYHYGDIVTLTANPQAGETFSSWGGDLGGSNNPETITINANKTVEANFAFIDYALTVTSAGGTGGTTDRVTVSAPGPYHYGDIVTLTANPQAGETFSSWGGDLGGSNNPETITINANKTVEANFAFIDYALTVTSAGGTGGTTDRVTVSAPGPYHYGDIVTLTANPQAGETFSSWGGDLGGSANPETITMNANKTVTANFIFIEYTLSVTLNEPGTLTGATVAKNPDQGTYHYGDTVQLTPTPGAGELFNSWGGDLSGSTNPETITIDGNKTVDANFGYADYTLSVTLNEPGTLTGATVPRIQTRQPITTAMW